jgi:hypothetical protein
MQLPLNQRSCVWATACIFQGAANRQEVINMTRINALRSIFSNTAGTRDSVAWGKNRLAESNQAEISARNTLTKNIATAAWGNINVLVFGAVLIVCSVAVGCSSDQPKSVSANNQVPITQTPIAPAPAPAVVAENKPATKKVVRKKPATVNYTDKTYGVAFEYPRRYAIETGNAATDLVFSNPLPMNFVQPGGVALAAVELPLTGYANTDFSSAFFDVSVHKNLTADQCTEFAVPQPKVVASAQDAAITPEAKNTQPMTSASSTETASTQNTSTPAETAKSSTPDSQSSSQPASAQSSSTQLSSTETAATATSQTATTATKSEAASMSPAQPASEAQGSKLLLGDMELHATEAVSGEGTQQSDSKYFHAYQNGACYEFALNVTTIASQEGLIKHVDRDKVFSQLEKILDTVKISPVATQEATTETPATASSTPTAAAAPAQ